MSLRNRLYHIVFGTDTKAGRRFDMSLLWTIILSVIIVMLESVPEYSIRFKKFFFYAEWFFTIIFSIEYLLRIYISPKPAKYIFSFWGIIDFMATLPGYLSFIIVGSQYFVVVRIIRVLRIFRILKLVRFTKEAQSLGSALQSSLHKILVFLSAVMAIIILLGTLMYLVEGGEKGFTSIPQSIYWAIVTVTTVGYGDLVPSTILGKVISSIAMIIGYAIIAVPTGIVTSELTKGNKDKPDPNCPNCDAENVSNAKYCNQCGNKLS